MRIDNNLDLDIEYVLKCFEFYKPDKEKGLNIDLNKKEYVEYLSKTIKTTRIMLDTVEKFKNKRFDKQLKRGLIYLKRVLIPSAYSSYINKSLNFLNYLIDYDLLYSSEHSRVLWIIEKLNKNEFSIIVKDEIKRFIIDFEFILDNAKNIDEIEREKSNFIPIIDLLNLPNKNDIIIASIYHLTAIQIHNEKQKNNFSFEVDFCDCDEGYYDKVRKIKYKYTYSRFLRISKKLINQIIREDDILFRGIQRETQRINKEISIYGEYISKNKRYSYFAIYEDEHHHILGIIPNTPHHITGYGVITNYYSYTPYDLIGGLKGYIFPTLDTLEIKF